MMKLMINTNTEKLRKIFANGYNAVTSLETPEGYVLLGGTFSQRAWLAGDSSQGLTVQKRKEITPQELELLTEADGHIYVFEDTLYLLSSSDLNNVKYPLELLEKFEKAGVEITDLR